MAQSAKSRAVIPHFRGEYADSQGPKVQLMKEAGKIKARKIGGFKIILSASVLGMFFGTKFRSVLKLRLTLPFKTSSDLGEV